MPLLPVSLFVLPVTVKSLKACSAVLLMASLTLFTIVPPTVIGALVTVISPTFKPLVSIAVLPVVTLSKLTCFAVAKLNLLAV